MDMIMDLLILLGDAFTLKGILKKKHRLIDYIIIFVVMLSIMLITVGKYNLLLIVVSIFFSFLISIIFGSITNTLFRNKKKK